MEAGCCQRVFCKAFVGGRAGAVALLLLLPGGVSGDLRKTARGASSPAKPALHIPELSIVSVCPSNVHRSRGPVAGRMWLVDVVGDADAGSPSTTGMAGVRCRGYDLTHCR